MRNLSVLRQAAFQILAIFMWFGAGFAYAAEEPCPDFAINDGRVLSDAAFAEYIKDPEVLRFRVSDAFTCHKLILYTRMWGPNGECRHGGEAGPIDAEILDLGMEFGELQITNHRNRCEYVEQIGLIPNGVRP